MTMDVDSPVNLNCFSWIKERVFLLFQFPTKVLKKKKKVNFFLLPLQDWEKCENGIANSLEKLRTFKKKLSQPLPDHHEELHAEQMRCKVNCACAEPLAVTCL